MSGEITNDELIMMEPTVYFQLGISEERFQSVVSRKITSILKTNESIGNLMLMVQGDTTLTPDEKFYAAFAIAKEDVNRKLIRAIPAIGKGMIKKVLED
jgi:hypothetical protein